MFVPVKLICFDVDGTLVGSSGAPTDAVWAAADRARAHGIHLAICTARLGSLAAWDWAVRLDPNGWHQFQTGASLMHTGTGESRSTPLPDGAAQEVDATAREHGWVFEAYSERDYIVDSDEPVAVAHAGLLGVPFVRRPLADLHGIALRTQYIVEDHDVARALAATPDGCAASNATSPVVPGANFVSITAAGVSKATGVIALASLVGCELADVMMVGDGQNDIPALQVAGHPVAMGNAHAEVFDVARYTVGHVENDGAADAIELALSL